MIENYLLDGEAIWDVIQSAREATSFSGGADIDRAIDVILFEMRESEIERRVLKVIGSQVFRANSPHHSVRDQLTIFVAQLQARLSQESLAAILEVATSEVDQIIAQGALRKFFDGKLALERLFKTQLHATGLPIGHFKYEIARRVKDRSDIRAFFESFFTAIL